MIAAGLQMKRECEEAGYDDEKTLWHVYLAMQGIVEFYEIKTETRH